MGQENFEDDSPVKYQSVLQTFHVQKDIVLAQE